MINPSPIRLPSHHFFILFFFFFFHLFFLCFIVYNIVQAELVANGERMEPKVLAQLKSMTDEHHHIAKFYLLFSIYLFISNLYISLFMNVFFSFLFSITGAMQPYLYVTMDWGTLADSVQQSPTIIPPVFPGTYSSLHFIFISYRCKPIN